MRLLEVVGLTKRLGGLCALDAVSFSVEEGEIVGLFGPNGSGKTTCLECLSGFATPDEGRVLFDGREITRQPAHALARLGIARTFQVARPFRGLTVMENVLASLDDGRDGTGMLARRWLSGAGAKRAQTLLETVGLTTEANQKAGVLPIGTLKRLELARALARSPRLILLDGPLGGLAHREARAVADVVVGLRAQGMTVVLAEQQMGTAMTLVDRVIVLDHGAVIAHGRPAEIRADRRVIEAYLDDGNGSAGAGDPPR